MADRYSNLYQTPPNGTPVSSTVAATPIYRGPMCERPGEPVTVFGTYTNTVAAPLAFTTTDTLHLCEVAEGSKLIELVIINSADLDTDNDFTFNLGFTGALTGFLSASTGLQAAAAVQPTLAALMIIAAAPAGGKSELLLTPAAGELEAAGTMYFMATFLIP